MSATTNTVFALVVMMVVYNRSVVVELAQYIKACY
jgi:hypothetical protein